MSIQIVVVIVVVVVVVVVVIVVVDDVVVVGVVVVWQIVVVVFLESFDFVVNQVFLINFSFFFQQTKNDCHHGDDTIKKYTKKHDSSNFCEPNPLHTFFFPFSSFVVFFKKVFLGDGVIFFRVISLAGFCFFVFFIDFSSFVSNACLRFFLCHSCFPVFVHKSH